MPLLYRIALLLIFGVSVAVVVVPRAKSEEQLYAEAQKFEQEENVDMLIKVYEELVDRFPKSQKADQALYKLALVYQNNQQDFAKAIGCHERLMKDYPQSRFRSQSHFMMAFIYANDLKDLEKARVTYNSFLEAFPSHELVPSVKWELEHLGQDISQLDLFSKANSQQEPASIAQANSGTKKAAKP